MDGIFHQRLNAEILHSEKRRTTILIFVFLFGLSYQLINKVLLKQADEETVGLQSQGIIWLFPLAMIALEACFLFYIISRSRKNHQQIPLGIQYLNVVLEVGLLSTIILGVSFQFPGIHVLQSPAVFIYFLFIILSTLRLDFGLSFFCGLLSALSFIIISLLTHGFNFSDSLRVIVILACGIAAGLVARQIRKGINRSLLELEKRHRIANLFGQHIAREVAETMLEHDGLVKSKRMNVAVLFIDIRNFSCFARDKSPEEIVDYQNAFLSIVIGIIAKHGGVVNQILGDGCMATFGAPLEMNNPSQHAVKAALELLEGIEKSITDGKLIPTRVGIGIHCGEVVTGNIGTAERKQYSITGSVVVLASRIEQLNKQLNTQLLISEEVAQFLHPKIPKRFTGAQELKGWPAPLGIYSLA